jgi:hypothetical protein
MGYIDGKISTELMQTIFDQSAGSIVDRVAGTFFLSTVERETASVVSPLERSLGI